jgi:membrane fusion protein (multidrug efflux system)
LIAAIRDDDYKAQEELSRASLEATKAGLQELHGQEQVADSKIVQAQASVAAAESQILAAQAGLAAADSAIRNAEAALNSAQANFQTTSQETERQDGLYAGKAATLQKVQSQQALMAAARAALESRQQDIVTARAQKDARLADTKRAQSGLESSRADVAAAVSSRHMLTAKEKEILAEIAARRAALQSTEIAVAYTRIVAPAEGYIATRNVLPGQMIGAGTTVVSLVEKTPWIQANFKETQLGRIHSGDLAEIKVDTFPSRSWKGHVLFLAPVSGAQTALLPPDNATGNFTKIAQRIPVKITLDANQDLTVLRPGMSASVSIRTGGGE